MLDEKTIEELHSYYDRLPGGICLVKADDSEEILLANAELLNYYQCANWQEFKELTGGTYRGMVEASDYIPLKDIVRVKGQPEANYAYFQFPYRTREGHFNKGNALLIRTKQKGLGDIWSINVMKSKYSRAPGETENITGLLGGTAFYKRVNEHIQMEKIDGTGGLYCPVYFNLTNFKLYNSNYGIEQGDELLRKVADVLRAHFPFSIIAHLNADNFALVAPRDGVIEKVEAVCREVDEMIDNFSITLKAGVFFRDPDNPSEYTANSAFDMAKIACDSIKGDASRSWATYTETMGKNLAARAYVLENFDRALRNGYIKIFYQPVVRTLTEKLCGMEALARWEDPERGRLTPDMFVPVLEDAKLIYKLDSYVVEQVGKRLRTMEDSGMPVLPISVNLSRADFDQVDPLDVVERVIRKYRLPRNYIRIEITESALVKDGKKLQREIDRFRKAGYQCWMDDFGSGYSSFNVLQNFHFDELKIDMAFLRNFNDQSRKIIKSIVLMAKSLGVHTLAEGAETQEQVDFLRAVGCEKIQGYFYGRPMKYDDLRVHCRERSLREETRQEEFAYDKLGLINVLTDAPVALCAVNDKSMRILYENDAYKKVLEDVSVSDLRQANANLAADDLPMHKKFRTFVDKAVDSMKKESMTYVDNGKYLRVNMEIVARTNQISVGRLALYNITFDDKFKETKRYDEIFRNAILFYDGIYYVHMDTGVLEVLETINPLLKAGDRIPYARQLLARYASRFIHRDDYERFMRYADARNLYAIAKASKRSEANNVFRVKQKDGNYRWKEFDAIVLYKSQSKDLLLCLRDATMERLREREEKVPEFFESFGYVPRNATKDYNQENSQIFINNALQSFLDFSGIKFFWKDKNRRFKGASNAFLNYYGLKLEDILGKTDEDMGWHINEGPYKDDEWAVLRHGRVKRHVIGHCIVKGVPHTIAASKFPIYDGNEIVGLAGYFNDVDKGLWRQEQQVKIGLTDPDTGLFGFRGMMMTGLQYADNYRLHGEDFCAIMMDVPDFDATVRMYGPQIRKKLLKRIQKALDAFDVQKRSLGHIGEGGNFLCFVKGVNAKQVHKYLLELSRNIHAITKIDGYDCTLYLRYSTAWCSESKNLDGMLRLLMERLNDQKLQKLSESVYIGDCISFDRKKFDDMDERVAMSDPDTYNLVYLNKALRHDLGLTEDEDITGKKCYEVLEGAKSPCEFCTNERLSRDYFYKWVHYDARTGQDYIMRDTLVPWRGKNYRFTFSTCLKDYVGKYLQENGEVMGKAAANEMIAIALDERDPDASIDKMLESIGESLQADKVMIFEEDEENVSATYEWKKDGVPSTIDKLQKIPREKAKALYQGFVPSEVTIINDPERMNKALKDGNISAVKINSLVSGHLAINRKSFGFVEVVNPAPDRLKDASLLLTACTRFLSVLMRNRDIYRRLRQLGNTDQLTGVMNRHRFMGLIQHIPQGEPIALIYADFNDLKDINDTDGHEAGDEALRKMACAMCSVIDQDRVFRVGGDEFIAVAEEVNLDDVKEIVRKMRQAFDEQGVSAALGYGIFKMPIDDIEAAIAEVDHWMYYDKRRAKEEQHKDQDFIPDHLPEKTASEEKEEGKENPEQ